MKKQKKDVKGKIVRERGGRKVEDEQKDKQEERKERGEGGERREERERRGWRRRGEEREREQSAKGTLTDHCN